MKATKGHKSGSHQDKNRDKSNHKESSGKNHKEGKSKKH